MKRAQPVFAILSFVILAASQVPAEASQVTSATPFLAEPESAPPPPPPPPVPGGETGGNGNPSREGPRREERPRRPGSDNSSALCAARYVGHFTKHGDRAELHFFGNNVVLYANGSAFNGQGRCGPTGDSMAAFKFALTADLNYVFRGTIAATHDGSSTLKAVQLKRGKVIDHLIMVH